jgi:hypothetical protein
MLFLNLQPLLLEDSLVEAGGTLGAEEYHF